MNSACKIAEKVDNVDYKLTINIEKLVDSYLYDNTWLTRENANTIKSYTGLAGFVAFEILKRYALFSSKGFKGRQIEAHLSGDIHIHDLPFARFIGYCAGWDLRKLLKEGLDTPFITARPPKHLSSAVDQIANFLIASQQEWAGAQAFSYVDIRLAPFVRADKLGYRQVKQEIQKLIYNLNFPSRVACQAPFTNFLFSIDSSKKVLDEKAIVGGVELDSILAEYMDECLMIVRAFIENYFEGDAKGRPFTFPIPTIQVTQNFDWSGRRWSMGDFDISYELFRLVAKRGTFYFLNCMNGYIDPDSRFAMCCRLIPDKNRILKICSHYGGIWSIPEATGSIGVVTLNLPRIGWLSKGEDDKLYELIDERLEIAREHLMQKRMFLTKILRDNVISLYITKRYLGTFNQHYNTIGIIGMHECLMNFAETPIWSSYGIKIAKNILEHINKRLREFEDEDNVLYNLEQTPAESTSHRLAMLDSVVFRREIERGEYHIQGKPGAYYYTNSTHIPYNAPIPLHEKIRIEAEFHPYFTGGCITHIWLFEEPEPEALRNFLRRVFTSTKIAYLTITPTITVCLKCGRYWVGIYDKCPQCGHKGGLEIYSRIVGYYRPIRLWNRGKLQEFMERVHYTLNSNEYVQPKEILKVGF